MIKLDIMSHNRLPDHNNPSIVVYFTVVMYILFLDFVFQDLELFQFDVDLNVNV
jgi:hypothetical protein